MSNTSAQSGSVTALTAGEKLPGTPYRIVRKLGAGAMGEVYEAVHEHLETHRALKVLVPQYAQRADMIERMRIEARALAKLRHAHLVEVLDLGISENGRWFFAMELLKGHTLKSVLHARRRLRAGVAATVAAQVLEGLAVAHAAGLVHRDVKPENVFLTAAGVVKVLDFGIAKLAQMSGAAITETGITIGTPRYMAPEQIAGKAVDARTDVYAVGVMLYEMLAGVPPFVETEPMALAYAHATKAPPRLAPQEELRVPARLEAAVMRALAKEPGERHADAAAFARELRGCAADVAAGAGEEDGGAGEAGAGAGAGADDAVVLTEVLRGMPPPERAAEIRAAETRTGTQAAMVAGTPAGAAAGNGRRGRAVWMVGAAAVGVGIVVGIAALRGGGADRGSATVGSSDVGTTDDAGVPGSAVASAASVVTHAAGSVVEATLAPERRAGGEDAGVRDSGGGAVRAIVRPPAPRGPSAAPGASGAPAPKGPAVSSDTSEFR